MCGVCERIQMTREGRNPYFVKELETGYVVIGDFQHFKGYTLFIYKEHVVELFDLAPAVRAKHLEEMTLVAKAVRDAFGAGKMNYECLLFRFGVSRLANQLLSAVEQKTVTYF